MTKRRILTREEREELKHRVNEAVRARARKDSLGRVIFPRGGKLNDNGRRQ